ncbi:MAG: glycosyltransferase family 39 protein [Candidatus Omnitrophica bacterium]|nr:glycosyltransferase family 39 protein [Candidatus Omnitrophota bacterium]
MRIIDRFLDFLSEKRTRDLLVILVIVSFPILSLFKLYPFENHFNSIINTAGDDWTAYANYASDIRHNGLLMHTTVPGAYNAPSGFLYPYFLALCFLIFGENTIPVYIIQSLMLGLSVVFVYWAFRDKMRDLTSAFFLGALALFAFLDVYKYYTFRLLSENLALFAVSLFFLCFVKGFEKNRLTLQLISAISMGVLILTRPISFLFGLLLIIIVITYFFVEKKISKVKLLLFISVLILTASLLGIRNYLVCHKFIFLPAQGQSMAYLRIVNPIPESVDLSKINTNFLYTKLHMSRDIAAYAEYVFQKPLLFLDYFLKKIVFCLGFLQVKVSFYRLRPHWVLMWMGYFTYLFSCIRNKKRMQLWEITTHLYIFFHYVPLIAFGQIENYGFRMLLPGISFVLLFSFLEWDMLRQNILSHRGKLPGEK